MNEFDAYVAISRGWQWRSAVLREPIPPAVAAAVEQARKSAGRYRDDDADSDLIGVTPLYQVHVTHDVKLTPWEETVMVAALGHSGLTCVVAPRLSYGIDDALEPNKTTLKLVYVTRSREDAARHAQEHDLGERVLHSLVGCAVCDAIVIPRADLWRVAKSLVLARMFCFEALRLSQERACAPGGPGRAADIAEFEAINH